MSMRSKIYFTTLPPDLVARVERVREERCIGAEGKAPIAATLRALVALGLDALDMPKKEDQND